MDALYDRASQPSPRAMPARYSAVSPALYVRAHWLRMPPLLLVRHLA
jgi:hypothetical protein